MFDHILIAVDGSSYSHQTIPITTEPARKFNADVLVLHVHERDLGRAVAFPLETPDDAKQLVAGVVKTLQDIGLTATGEVRPAVAGHAPKEIVETAKARESDLIVMGSRGPSDIAGLLLGSVTHKVRQLAHIPVLVVRTPESASKKETVAATAARAGTNP